MAADDMRASKTAEKKINRIESPSRRPMIVGPLLRPIHYHFARESLTQSGRGRRIMVFSKGGLAMLNRDLKELLIGWGAILIFAIAFVYFRQ